MKNVNFLINQTKLWNWNREALGTESATEYPNELESDKLENQDARQVVHQEEDDMGNQNNGNEMDIPEVAPVDTELHGQTEETAPEDSSEDVKDIPLLDSSREENQKPPMKRPRMYHYLSLPQDIEIKAKNRLRILKKMMWKLIEKITTGSKISNNQIQIRSALWTSNQSHVMTSATILTYWDSQT
ncbi:Protein CBG17527 [Caenorhabditis briggsae]|uniref:Protein CBG17527 n=1 Tax=Caenorhabditis briggsae TaxID=6238 RepID=A8XRD9_CAEBR|nr:Protein CBG17527 [Caenorhabditis briggsae]CAP35158.1 Protein CBG17527 [Caenorhabditis briggsae]